MTTQADQPRGQTTLTASGIARLANVGRAAVSNWRRRYADFPTPVGGTPTSPSFDAHEVEQWLRLHGRLHKADAAQRAWQQIESYQPAAQLTEALTIAGAYLLNRCQRNDPAENALPGPKQLVSGLRALDTGLADMVSDVLPPQWTPQLTAVLEATRQLALERDPEAAFEYLHNQYVTSANPMSGLAGTPDTVAEVMLALAGSGERVFDFTSGTGSILRMAADQALQAGRHRRCYAQEIKPQYALITLLRLWLVQLRAQQAEQVGEPPVVHVGDSLLADALPDLRADVVVANFPFGIHDWGHNRLAYDARWTYGLPPRTEPELAWVQHALAHLASDGTAVVLMPPAAALRPAGRRVRAELLRRGALRAVIALPAGLMPPVGIGLHIWVLTQPTPQQAPEGLLVVDTTAAPPDRSLLNVVEKAWHAYLSGERVDEPGVWGIVPVIDVLDDQVDLTPQRHLPQVSAPPMDPAAILGQIKDFQRRLDDLRNHLPPVRPGQTTSLRAASHADIADLIRSGSISVHRATSRRQATSGAATSEVITTSDVLTGSPATGSTRRATNDLSPPRVQAGDILMPLIGTKMTARVARGEQIGADLGPGLQLIRVDKARFDPWFVAGVLSRTDNLRIAGRASSTANGTLRIDIRRLTIPVLPLAEQQAYGEAFRRLIDFNVTLEQTTEAGAALARDIGDSLFGGSLEIAQDL
ncbi:N-6 DNA methylase [Micromonospora chersina]